MTDFTYEIPNEEKFLQAVIIRMRGKGNGTLACLLAGSKCSIIKSASFSRKRWDAYYTTVDFAFPSNKYDEIVNQIDDTSKEIIKDICNDVMPAKNGLDVMEVTFSISLEDMLQTKDSMEDLKKIADALPVNTRVVVIPEDIRAKAKVMSEVYLYTYCAENALRAFIEAVAKGKYPEEFMSKLSFSKDMKDKIKARKKLQEKKKWLSTRGTSDIFYLDIDDLGKLIGNNWKLFEPYFDKLDWVKVNINEIADCRNQVAHHSYLEETERDIIRTDFVKILRQIGDTYK